MATGLSFPGVAGGLSIAFKWASPFAPSANGITVVYHGLKVYTQDAYHWAFGYARGDGTWDATTEYFGANPYPDPPTTGSEKWELSMGGGDVIGPAISFGVFKNVAYRMGTDRNHMLCPDTSNWASEFTAQEVGGHRGEPVSAVFLVGDALWSAGNEVLFADWKGLTILNKKATQAEVDQIVAGTYTGGNVWYENRNWTPSDISDKSGAGNNPAWENANRPGLWTDETADHRASAPFSTLNPTTSATVVLSATIQPGDDIYTVFTSRDHTSGTARATVTDNDTTGNTWALVGESADRKANIYWKKATAATAGKTVTVAGAVGSLSGGYSAYCRTLASGDPTVNLVIETNISGNETHAGFTPSHDNTMVVFVVFNYANDNLVTALTAATLGSLEPERFEKISTGGLDCGTILASKAQVGAATGTGDFTWAQANGTTYSAAWAIRPAVVTTITGTSTKTLTITGSATGTVDVVGSSSRTLSVSGSASGTVPIDGASTHSLVITGSATGTVQDAFIEGTSSATLLITGSASGTVAIDGTSSRSLVVTGSATGTAEIVGTSSRTLAITGTATGTVAIGGASSRTLAITGSATGTVTDGDVNAGTSIKSLVITGSATGTALVSGSSTRALPVSGTATGTVSVSGSSVQTLTIGGTAQGTVSLSGSSQATLAITGSAQGSVLVSASSIAALIFGGSASGTVADTPPDIDLVLVGSGTSSGPRYAGSTSGTGSRYTGGDRSGSRYRRS